jgi:hypothetical protein
MNSASLPADENADVAPTSKIGANEQNTAAVNSEYGGGLEQSTREDAQSKTEDIEMPFATEEEHQNLPWDGLWEIELLVKTFQEAMFPPSPRDYPPARFYPKDIFFTRAFSGTDFGPLKRSNLAKCLGNHGEEQLECRLQAAATFMAYAANTSLEEVKFDYSTLTEPLEPHHIEAKFTWLAFKDSDLRDIEARDGLAPGDANLILEALAKTPIYTGTNLGETFIQVTSAPKGAPAGLDVRLGRKCYSVL